MRGNGKRKDSNGKGGNIVAEEADQTEGEEEGEEEARPSAQYL